MSHAGLTARGRAFLAAGVVMSAGGMVLGYRDLTRIGMLLLVLCLLGALLVRSRGGQLRAQRQLAACVARPGQHVAAHLEVYNAGRARTWPATAQEDLPYALGDRPRFALPGIEAGGARAVDYRITAGRRGRYLIPGLSLRSADPFGLATRTESVSAPQELIVLPLVVPLHTATPPLADGETEGDVAQMIALHGERDVTVRHYWHGDDLRQVHWPATAHRGELMVRQHDRPVRRSALLLLDPAIGAVAATLSEDRADGAADSSFENADFELAVTALASIATVLADLGFRLHLAQAVQSEPAPFLPGVPFDADRALDEILLELAVAEPEPAGNSEPLLRSARTGLRERAVVVAVVGTHPDVITEVAALRRTSGVGLALVVGEDHGAVEGVGILRDAGWRAEQLAGKEQLQTVWSRLTERSVTPGMRA